MVSYQSYPVNGAVPVYPVRSTLTFLFPGYPTNYIIFGFELGTVVRTSNKLL